MTQSPDIRRAVLADASRIAELSEDLGYPVDEGAVGRRLGRLLVEEVESWAASCGLRQVSVRSNVLRAGAHPFYERQGYARVKTQHAYRKRLRLRE